MKQLFILLLILPLLAACDSLTGGGVSAGDAEETIRALYEGDAETANEHLCGDAQVGSGEFALEDTPVTLENVTCEENDDQMACEIELSGEGIEGTSLNLDVTFDITEDGELCNPQGFQ